MAGAHSFVLRVAAQNIDATVYDTNDLSTIRGSGLALLAIVERLGEGLSSIAGAQAEVRIVYSGASELLARIESTDPNFSSDAFVERVRDDLAKSVASNGHTVPGDLFTIAVAAVKEASGQPGVEAVARAEARVRVDQYRTLSFPLPAFEPDAKRPCDLDRVHGATRKGAGGLVSATVKARHVYGRDAKQRFYAERLRRHACGTATADRLEGSKSFTRSLVDLTANTKDPFKLPPALSGKIALVHLDGNGFGALRASLMPDPDQVSRFSTFVAEQQTRLLARLIDWALDRRHMTCRWSNGKPENMLRIETLLWGGDEMVFAVPAWAAWDLVREIEADLADWALKGIDFPLLGAQRRLTHAIGLLYANAKTPIRQMRALADELVGEAKDAGKEVTRVAAFAFESVDLPLGGIEAARRSLLYGGRPPEGAKAAKATIGVEGADLPFAESTRRLRALKRRFARSQAMKLALDARDSERGLAGAHGDQSLWMKDAAAEIERVVSVSDAKDVIAALGLAETQDSAPFPWSKDARALQLLQALHVWDYAEPFGEGCLDPAHSGGGP